MTDDDIGRKGRECLVALSICLASNIIEIREGLLASAVLRGSLELEPLSRLA